MRNRVEALASALPTALGELPAVAAMSIGGGALLGSSGYRAPPCKFGRQCEIYLARIELATFNVRG